MRREHIKDGWWEIPGEPVPTLGWPGTKNGESHRVWLPAAARELLVDLADDASTGFVFAGSRGRAVAKLDEAMRTICAKLGAERATPHDLRRTFSTTVTGLGFGRDTGQGLRGQFLHCRAGLAAPRQRRGHAPVSACRHGLPQELHRARSCACRTQGTGRKSLSC